MNHTLIIAEAGVNHNGSLKLAKKLVDKAKECNVDIVKFQTARPESLVSRFAEKAEYQKASTGTEESQLDMIKKLLLTFSEYEELAEYCRSKDVAFLSTPFDLESINFLDKFKMPFWKIPSGEITNYPYLVKIAQTGKPVIMSTGMCELEEIDDAMKVLRENGSKDISLLHCNTEYPTPYEDVNLLAMNTLRERYNVKVGYSDHTTGIEVPVAAVALGAAIIEKHFTLDRNMEGPDHKASLEPTELAQMVRNIRNVEKAIGKSDKHPTVSEKKNIVIARKSIVAARAIQKGETFTIENITTKRPGNGISPMKWNEVLGSRAPRGFKEDELIEII
ncbi:MAG: N-acetylneuraminate synthase [Lachnospiraceae bacterium]|nr:N-acetylneuraminate synthase [Lachnospiraceae bacterium]